MVRFVCEGRGRNLYFNLHAIQCRHLTLTPRYNIAHIKHIGESCWLLENSCRHIANWNITTFPKASLHTEVILRDCKHDITYL